MTWKFSKLCFSPLLLVTLIAACTVSGGPIHLPSGAIEPDTVDPALVDELNTLIASGRGDAAFVCIVRFAGNLSEPEIADLAEVSDILKGSRRDTWYLYTSAATVASLVEDERVLWIGEYRSEYRYGRRADTIGEDPRWMLVVSFAGNQPEFVTAMIEIGLDDIRYDSIADEYHVYADAAQIEALSRMWWVKEIYKAGGRGLNRLMCW